MVFFQSYRLTSSCNLDVHAFPFDKQKCNLTMTASVYQDENILLKSVKTSKAASQDSHKYYISNGEWKFEELRTINRYMSYGSLNCSAVIYEITMSRRSIFYVLVVIIPMFALFLLDMAISYAFGSPGEKIAFKVTLILQVTFLSLILTDKLPATSDDPPTIAKFFTGMFVLLIFGILENAFELYLREKKSKLPSLETCANRCKKREKKVSEDAVTCLDENILLKSVKSSKAANQDSHKYYMTNGEWKFEELRTIHRNISYGSLNCSAVIYEITMSRRSIFYVLVLIIPMFTLFLLDMVISYAFSSPGEKVAFKMTLILEVTFLSLSLTEMLPATSEDPPTIAKFFTGMFMLLVFGTLENAFEVYFGEKKLKLPSLVARVNKFKRNEKRESEDTVTYLAKFFTGMFMLLVFGTLENAFEVYFGEKKLKLPSLVARVNKFKRNEKRNLRTLLPTWDLKSLKGMIRALRFPWQKAALSQTAWHF
nr:uncharacterized protein LOC132765552 [Anolis sagrei ordinatus]